VEYKQTIMHMGIPFGGTLKSDEPLAVKVHTKTSKRTLEPLFIETLLTVFPELKFRIEPQDSDYSRPTVYEGKVSDRDAYFRALNEARRNDLVVSRMDLGTVIIKVAREVYKMHQKNMVHGDVKPSNILFLKEGVKLIDSRGCKKGAISPTFTPGWASPEQVLGKSIDFTADTYALGMLALQLVDGEIYGEIKTFKMPGASNRIEVLDTEGVWIENSSKLNEKSKIAWRNGLAKFLSFSPEARPKDGEDFANQLESLLKEHPLHELDGIEFDSKLGCAKLGIATKSSIVKNWPEFAQANKIKGLEYIPCWILQDQYSSIL